MFKYTNDANIGETAPEESSTSEMSPQEQEALNSIAPEVETEQPTEKQEDDTSEEANTPFHKNPRWRQMREKVKNYETENSKLKEELEKLKSPKPEEQVEEQKTGKTVNYSVVDELFKETSEFEFKNDYETVADMYKDFRRAIMGDLLTVRESQDNAQKTEEEKYNAKVNAVLEEMDPEQQKEFIEYAKSYIEESQDLPPIHGDYLTDAVISFLKEYSAPKQIEVKKPTSKVNKSNKPSVSKVSKPSQSYIKSKSMDEIIADHLG